jgi:CubicO group peptidase (beta-lactamase class C family)
MFHVANANGRNLFAYGWMRASREAYKRKPGSSDNIDNVVKKFRPALRILLLFHVVIVTSAITAASEGVLPALHETDLQPIAEIVSTEIAARKVPGAVVLVGQDGHIAYSHALGMRALRPQEQPMTVDTIFDLASLTKVIATGTAVMQLAEKGKLRLDDPVAKYWPEFGANGKARISVRQLLTHYSGLRPDLDLNTNWFGYNAALSRILRERPIRPPGTAYVYSDINFEILGELVRRVSGMPLDKYCAEKIFKPLGMKDTGFRPQTAQRERIAPTEYRNGKMLRGEVHDPTAYRMGGVAGHAGLFSSGGDLAVFAQMLLDGGRAGDVEILSSRSVAQMTTPQSPPNQAKWRGLAWDIVSPSDVEAFPAGSYGHTGFTGTSLWIDPISRTYVIVLTNRVHPNGSGDVRALRTKIATVVESALRPVVADQSPGPSEKSGDWY